MDQKLQTILASYSVKLNTSKSPNGKDVFVDLVDKNNDLLQVTVQYSDNRIYCVYFLNNQYFEEDSDTLWEVLDAILTGNYQVHQRGLFKKKRCIGIRLGARVIGPERITQDKGFETIYSSLPIAFTKK